MGKNQKNKYCQLLKYKLRNDILNCLSYITERSKYASMQITWGGWGGGGGICPFADFNRPKLDLCTNLQQKHCTGEQIFLLLNNAHHIREMDFGDLPQIGKKSPMFHWEWLRGGSGVAQGWLAIHRAMRRHVLIL